MFCCTLLYVHFSIAIILMGKRELIALLNLSSWCLVMVERLFLTVPQGCLQFVIVVFPDHTHLLFLNNFSERFIQTDQENMEEMWTDFKSSIQEIIEKRVPTKMTSARHSFPWMNGSIKRAIRRKQRAYRKFSRTNAKRDRDRYRWLQQQVQWETRRANRQYMQDIVSESYTDKPKRFWSYVKSKGQESIGVAPLKNKDGFLQSDNQSKAEILNQQFSSFFFLQEMTTAVLPSKATALILQCRTSGSTRKESRSS